MNTIFDELREDHARHRTLLNLVARTKGDSEGRRELFDRLKADLESHAAVEERTLYAAMLSDEATREEAGHSIKEHKEMETLVQELEQKDYANPQWLQRFGKLKSLVEHHEAEEEEETFRAARGLLSESEQAELGERFRREKSAGG